MNSEETKFVTVDDNSEEKKLTLDDKFDLRLFFLPYVLKCEMSMELKKEWLGF